MPRLASPSRLVFALLTAVGTAIVAVNAVAGEPTLGAETAVERCAERLMTVASDSDRGTASILRDELALTLGPCDGAIERLVALARSAEAITALSDLRLPPGCAASLGTRLVAWTEGLPHDHLRAAVTSLVNADPCTAGVLLPRLPAPKTLDTALQALFDVEAPLPSTIWSQVAAAPALSTLTVDARTARVLARLGDDSASRDAWTRALNAALAEPDAVARLMALKTVAAEVRSAVDHRTLDLALASLPPERCNAPEIPRG